MDKRTIALSQAMIGYTLAANARRLSKNTLLDYSATFRKLQAFLPDDPPFSEITADSLRGFLNSLDTLSKKSLLNVHTGLSSLWKWAAAEGLVEHNIVRDIEPPRPESREVVPFTEAEIKALVTACARTKRYQRKQQRPCDNGRPSAERDRAMLLLLVDTGIRATELCELKIYHTDLKNLRVTVEHGKGDKERVVPISARTSQAIWKYLTRRDNAPKANYLFVSREGRPFDRQTLRHLLDRLGERAGVSNVHPHRFRHTFAITFLRNGGDVFTLQKILGHSSMDMVKRYLAIAQVDIQAAHREASPVANWLL